MATTTLSTLDGGAPRVYIRYALTFACNAIQALATSSEHLPKAVKSLVNEIPMLAGCVTTTEGNKPTVRVTLQQVENFRASITHLENTRPSYDTIRQQGIPPLYISGTDVTPLEDAFNSDTDSNTNPACAIQANFITGGLILVIFLHHAIADIRGIGTIMRLMSEGLTTRILDQETLDEEALSRSSARARLSDGFRAHPFLSLARDLGQRVQQSRQPRDQPVDADDGETDGSDNESTHNASPNVAAVLRFNLNKILFATGVINDRRFLHGRDAITPRETLITLLWRAYTRARWPQPPADGVPSTSVSFPMDLRNHLAPPLDEYWMGNATVTAIANEKLLYLGLPYGVTSMSSTAKLVHWSANSAASDLLTRARINLMNATGENSQESLQAQLVVHDWTPLPPCVNVEGMDLGLKLGTPDAIRRTGRSVSGNEIVLLPVKEGVGVWEVQVELPREVLERMLQDDYFGGFLMGFAQ